MPFATEARANLKLALPLIAAQLAGVGMGAVDTMFAGHLTPKALVAVAIGANINVVPFVFFAGLFMAASAIVSKRRGEAARHEDGLHAANAAASVGAFARGLLLLAIACGLTWTAGIWLLAPAMIHGLHLAADTEAVAVGYLRCYGFSGIGLCLWFCLRYCAEGLSASRPVMWVGLLGFVLNALLNWLLIYGAGPIPALGVNGSGIATALACLAMPLAMLLCYARLPSLRLAGLFTTGMEAGAAATALRLGLPIGTTMLAEAGLFVAVSLLMARLGESVVAAHQVAINVASIAFMIPLGIALATTVRVAFFAGAAQPRLARRAGWSGMGLGFANALLNAAVMLLGGSLLVRAYTADAGIAAQATGFLALAAAFQIFDGVQVTASGALRGLHDTRRPMFITLAAYWLVGMPVAWWLAFGLGLGPNGLWWGLTAGLAAAAFGLAARFSMLKVSA